MKTKCRILALLCAAALLLSACGSSKKAAPEPSSHEITWTEGQFGHLNYQYPDSMAELPFTPSRGTDGVAYGISSDEGKFFGFSLELIACEPGDYDQYDYESFLQKYFPEHWDEYGVSELGDEYGGTEIARYTGNPVFVRAEEEPSGAELGFENADYLLEYLILDEGNNRSRVYILSVYDGYDYYPGTYEDFGGSFCRKLVFDSAAAKAEDLASEDNSLLDAEGAVFEPLELVLGNYPQHDIPPYYLTVVGAEFCRHDGKEAIRIIYDVKNLGASYDRMWQAYEYFRLAASQDGEVLTKTWEYEANEKELGYDGSNPEVLLDAANYIYDNEYANNRRCIMRNGYSVRTAEEFLCDWQGGPITLRISLPIYEYNRNFYADDDPLIVELSKNCVKEVTFDPAELPCRVKNSEWLIRVDDPAWTSGLAEEGDIFADDERYIGHIRLGDAEYVDVDGRAHMLLHLTYTNNGTETNSLFELLAIPVWKSGMADGIQHFWVMQDGVSLLLLESELTKNGRTQLVQPGETAEYVLEYLVRSDSPIEVEVNYGKLYTGALYDGKAAGRVYRP